MAQATMTVPEGAPAEAPKPEDATSAKFVNRVLPSADEPPYRPLALNQRAESDTRSLSYRWNAGDEFKYTFSYRFGNAGRIDSQTSAGSCYLKIGEEETLKDEVTGTGTGFAIAPGYIATCAHVVKNAAKVTGVFGEQRFAARVIAIDPQQDIAILKIDDNQTLTPLTLGKSSELELAENVLVIGFPMTNVLGEGIKVSSGMVSGIDVSKGGQAIAIDGAINPGNSGGPVLNYTGEVVGLASATLNGGVINPVGFASQVESLRALMQKHDIPALENAEPAEAIQAKDIMRQVKPSIGLLEIGAHADDHFRTVKASVRKSGGVRDPFEALNQLLGPDPSQKAMKVSRLGDVRGGDQSNSLPFLFATVPELILQRFDADSSQSWTVSTGYRLKSRPASPLPGLRGFPGFPSRRGGLLNPMFGMRPEPEEEPKVIEATLKCSFEVLSTNANVVTIKKTRHLMTHDDAQSPLLEVSGDGTWKFDLAAGVPISLTEKLTVIRNEAGEKTEQPLEFSFKRAELSKADKSIVNKPTPSQSKSTRRVFINGKEVFGEEAEKHGFFGVRAGPATTEEVDKLLAEMGEKQTVAKAQHTLHLLRNLSPNDERRDAVLTALRAQIATGNKHNHNDAWQTYLNWMDDSCAPELRRVIAKSETHRSNALKALAKLENLEDAPLFLAHISQLDFSARRTLKDFGTKIEEQVLNALETATDSETQSRLIDLIGDTVSRDNIPRLKEIVPTLTDGRNRRRLLIEIRSLEITTF